MIFILFGLIFLFANNAKTEDISRTIPYQMEPNISSTLCCPCKATTLKPSPLKTTTTQLNQSDISINFLPDSVIPLTYRLSMKIDFNELKKVSLERAVGNLTIDIICRNETDIIYLNVYFNLKIETIFVKPWKSNEAEINLIRNYQNMPSIFKINLVKNLTVGMKYIIVINNFISTHSANQDSGILQRGYQTDPGKFEYLLATQLQPDSARTVFPCFDEPRFKAKFQLNITTNHEYSILSNMPETDCKKFTFNNTIWKKCSFETTPIMPLYNLAFAIVNFDFIEKYDKKGRRYRIWARKSQIKNAHFALESTMKALQLFESKLKVDFPLRKIDSLAIPNLKGFLGMEHYGLITYEEPVLIWNEKFPLTFSKLLCLSIICHEIAHQWFGNLVTTTWWDDLWLNEGFATFYSHMITKEILNDEYYYPMQQISIFNYVRNFDDYFSTLKSSISAPIKIYLEEKFDYLSYKKGFIMVNMLENILGKSSFDRAITDYLNVKKFDSVTPLDLWNSLNKFTKYSLSDVMDNWLSKICYPIVKVRQYKNISIQMIQNSSINIKMIKFENKYKDILTDKWNIPLYVMFGNNSWQSNIDRILLDKSYELKTFNGFNISQHWLIINTNYSSFFTTDYDSDMFKRIIEQMLKNHLVIPPVSRAQIIQDYYDLSKKFQRNNLDSLLKLLIYLKHESHPVPISTAINIIDKLNGLFELRSFYPKWRKYVSRILDNIFKKLVKDFLDNFRDKKSTYLTLRQSILNLACKLKLDHCLKITNIILRRWKANKLINSDYDLLHIALCKYMEMDENGENWKSVYSSKRFLSWDYMNVKYYAMGCTRVPWIIEKNIDIAYNVLKNSIDRKKFPHVSEIVIDNILPDYLHGTTSLSNLLVLSSIYNTPNSINFLTRFKKDGLILIYNSLLFPHHFPLSNSIVEYAIPTLSHYNFIVTKLNQKDKTRNAILKEAKNNIDWILQNKNMSKLLKNLI